MTIENNNTKSNILYALLFDVRFWIILFFVIRLFNINAPIFDSHDWRQADGYAIARNFFEIDSNILYPRVDGTGHFSGILGTEFPIMNYVVHLFYQVFGVDWWPGRLLNLILSSLGCYYFYKIINEFIKKEIALSATLILIGSIWFAHSRKFMPDVFSASLVLIGVYFGWRFLKTNKGLWSLVLFVVLITVGLLSKLPSFIVTTLLLPALIDKGILFKRKVIVMVVSLFSLVPIWLWYYWWIPNLTTTFGYESFYMGASISESLEFLTNEWNNALKRFYADAIYFVGFALYLLGWVFLFIRKNKLILTVFIAASILQLIFMLKGGESFVHLSYYIIPFVPIMAIVAAFGVSNIKWKWLRFVLILAVLTEGILNQQHDFMFKPDQDYKLAYESVADKYTGKDDLIAINNNFNPSALYFSHRKGWSFNGNHLSDHKYFEAMVKNGCKLLIWDKSKASGPTKIPFFHQIAETDYFLIYKPEVVF